jgi:hypothetical protein
MGEGVTEGDRVSTCPRSGCGVKCPGLGLFQLAAPHLAIPPVYLVLFALVKEDRRLLSRPTLLERNEPQLHFRLFLLASRLED